MSHDQILYVIILLFAYEAAKICHFALYGVN